jgi:predicted dehydrogenase
MSITPLILGSGGSGNAIAKSLAVVNLLYPKLDLKPAEFLTRGTNLAEARKKYEHAVLCIANPHGLHTDALLRAQDANFDAVLCEKPAAVSLDQVRLLESIQIPTAIFHVYRQTWGIQTLKKMIEDQEFGDVFSIEGRYWQASAADAALKAQPGTSKGWKDDAKLSGLQDVYLDLGAHWVDAASFLYGSVPTHLSGYRSYVNANSPHRETYVRLILDYPNHQHALTTVSKNIHGAGNRFEISVLGAKKTAHWNFSHPDQIEIGQGRDLEILSRKNSKMGSQQSPGHGMGWVEGYIEITAQLLNEVFLKIPGHYPRLSEQLQMLEAMFKIEWT